MYITDNEDRAIKNIICVQNDHIDVDQKLVTGTQ